MKNINIYRNGDGFSLGRLDRYAAENCGTGHGGFKAGNTCWKGRKSGESTADQEKGGPESKPSAGQPKPGTKAASNKLIKSLAKHVKARAAGPRKTNAEASAKSTVAPSLLGDSPPLAKRRIKLKPKTAAQKAISSAEQRYLSAVSWASQVRQNSDGSEESRKAIEEADARVGHLRSMADRAKRSFEEHAELEGGGKVESKVPYRETPAYKAHVAEVISEIPPPVPGGKATPIDLDAGTFHVDKHNGPVTLFNPNNHNYKSFKTSTIESGSLVGRKVLMMNTSDDRNPRYVPVGFVGPDGVKIWSKFRPVAGNDGEAEKHAKAVSASLGVDPAKLAGFAAVLNDPAKYAAKGVKFLGWKVPERRELTPEEIRERRDREFAESLAWRRNPAKRGHPDWFPI